MKTRFDPGLQQRQRELAKDFRPTKAFCSEQVTMPLKVDEKVYEAARVANLEEMKGGNIWDEKEYRQDMLRRHPELGPPLQRKVFVLNVSDSCPALPGRNRFGKVKERIRFRDGCRICDRSDGIRIVTNQKTGEVTTYDLKTGQQLTLGEVKGNE